MSQDEPASKLAYVIRFRNAFRGRYVENGEYRSGPVFHTKKEADHWAVRKREELERRANGEPRFLPRAFYKTIPLDHKYERKDDAPDVDRAQEQWLELDLATPQHAPRSPDAHVCEPGREEPNPPGLESLQKLDSVVHDFVASLDQGTLGGPGEEARSTNADRLMRLLDYSPSTRSQVLGPPVLLGASPAIGLETLLGMLGSLQKTGILRVQAGNVLFMVSIVKGDVVHGVSYPRPPSELLGSILVSRGTIDAERLDRFFDECGCSASRIGEALNQQALVPTDQLKSALEHQLQLLFDRLLSTRESEWCFHEGEATLAYIHMRMNVISVLLESARKNDERVVA